MPITTRSGAVVGLGAGAHAPAKPADPFTDGLDEETTKRLAAWSMVRLVFDYFRGERVILGASCANFCVKSLSIPRFPHRRARARRGLR